MSSLDTMIPLAREAMRRAYAPYSKFPVGACLRTDGGRFYAAANVENAAYPQGQCAEASAIGMMVAGGDLRIVEVVVMGGAFGTAGRPGNVSPVAEANVYNDPHAADRVLTAPWPVRMVGLDVTTLCVMSGAYMAALRDRAPGTSRKDRDDRDRHPRRAAVARSGGADHR